MKYIGHIDVVPVTLLNRFKDRVEFFKDLKVMTEKYGGNPEALREWGPQATISIHLPSNDLLQLNQVTWREECCTEAIQEMLDDKWKIVAVIPRPGNRRPDYILGKIKEPS